MDWVRLGGWFTDVCSVFVGVGCCCWGGVTCVDDADVVFCCGLVVDS